MNWSTVLGGIGTVICLYVGLFPSLGQRRLKHCLTTTNVDHHQYVMSWRRIPLWLDRFARSNSVTQWILSLLSNQIGPLELKKIKFGLVIALGIGLLMPLIGALIPLIMFSYIGLSSRRKRQQQASEVAHQVPIVADLIGVVVSAGGNLYSAIDLVSTHLRGPLIDELRHVMSDVDRGMRFSEALSHLNDRRGDTVRPLVNALISAESRGAPLSVNLRLLSQEARFAWEQNAERSAKKLSVQLLFPVAAFTLPSFALLTVAPILAGTFNRFNL